MKLHAKIALSLLGLGLVGLGGLKFMSSSNETQEIQATSDARATKGKIVVGKDNFIGYFPLCSPEMSRRLRRSGYQLECQDDGGDYAGRFDKLDKGKLNFAVATVDAYALNGAAESYPGTIISVLDESKGGDALVAWEDEVSNLDELKDKANLKVAFTPNSPSHHLIKSLAVHFGIDSLDLNKDWQVKTDSSKDALKSLLKKESQAAVLWEPDLSRAIQEGGIKRIIGTEQTKQLVVDVLIVNRKFAKDNPDVVVRFMKDYFRTLKFYRDNPDELVSDVKRKTGLSKDIVKSMLNGVEWQSLSDNAEKWFGVTGRGTMPQEALVDTIEASVDILIDYGSVDFNPLPSGDPYRIINSRPIDDLFKSMSGVSGFDTGSRSATGEASFAPLTEQQWSSLKEIGSLRVGDIIFASGSDQLTMQGKNELDVAVDNLEHYPSFRVLVRGHTGTRGNKEQNKQLSQARAEAVVRYLDITHSIPSERLKAIGHGGEKPLARMPGESRRAYNYRLPRVELVLVGEDI